MAAGSFLEMSDVTIYGSGWRKMAETDAWSLVPGLTVRSSDNELNSAPHLNFCIPGTPRCIQIMILSSTCATKSSEMDPQVWAKPAMLHQVMLAGIMST